MLVDARWDGNFGIGRFGREVRARLRENIGNCREYHSPRSALTPRGILGLWRELRASRPDVFYSPAFTGTLRVAGVPQLLTVFDLIHLEVGSERAPEKSLYYERILKPAILQAGWVATCSDYSAERINEWLGRDAGSTLITNVGCGVSDAFSESRDSELRPNRILLVSNMRPHKNVATLLKAVSLMPDVRLEWVVDDPQRASALVRAHAPNSDVSLHSGLSDRDLARLYKSSAALVMPTLLEGFGLPAIESMACGTPVVYSHECIAVREQCEPVPGNLAVDKAQSPHQWVEAIRSLLTSPSRVSLSPQCRAKYSWDTVGRNVSDAIADYIAAK